jgi:hypothetical protein
VRCRLFSRIARLDRCRRRRHDSRDLCFVEIRDRALDERFAIEVGVDWTRRQLFAHQLVERRTPNRRARRGHAPQLGAAQVELEAERAAFVLTDRLVIQLAGDVPRNVPHREPHDLVVDSVHAGVDDRANAVVDFGGDEIARVDLRQGD